MLAALSKQTLLKKKETCLYCSILSHNVKHIKSPLSQRWDKIGHSSKIRGHQINSWNWTKVFCIVPTCVLDMKLLFTGITRQTMGPWIRNGNKGIRLDSMDGFTKYRNSKSYLKMGVKMSYFKEWVETQLFVLLGHCP